MTGFEPAASCSQSKRSTKLSHIRIFSSLVLYTTFREKAITKWQPNGEAVCISLVIASAVGAWQSAIQSSSRVKLRLLFILRCTKPSDQVHA